MPDYLAQRMNMVESQVRPNDVTDMRIHDAMRTVPRERFVPSARQSAAYTDAPMEVAPGRHLMEPRSFAKLLQLAQIEPTDNVLDVGCATGYSTAVLAMLAAKVTGLEQDADLIRVASDMISGVAKNATIVQGALAEGFKGAAPYDVIFINGAIEVRPETLFGQLAEGGRLVAILKTDTHSRANLFVRDRGRVGARADFDAAAPILAGFRQKAGFVF
jgi:protein-L-isoaspartate(D-aspartate) O-methyltransferase